MVISELFNWAVGSNIKHAESPYRQNDNVIIWLKPAEILPLIDPNWRVSPDDRTNHIGSRMNKATAHAESGGWFDPPDVYFNPRDPRFPISIGNGRHRIAAALKAGEEWIPANVEKDDVAKIQQIVTTKSI